MTSLHLTLGDPTGIGPEVVAAALSTLELRDRPVIHGHASVLARAAESVGVYLPEVELREPPAGIDPGAQPGAAQRAYLDAALAAIAAGQVDALVTGPIHKATLRRETGFEFPGHTELLASAAGVSDAAMLFAGPSLRVLLATVHIPLAEVPRR